MILKTLFVAWSEPWWAVLKLPSLSSVALAALLLGVYALIALPIGFHTQFLTRKLVADKAIQWRILLSTLLTPAITEEVVFRVLLLPSPSTSPPLSAWLLWGTLSLILFILYHPLNGWLWFPPGRVVFQTPSFLGLAALLGMICTLSYADSGSLWIPALMHWIIVVVWLLGLGGYDKLNPNLTGEVLEHRRGGLSWEEKQPSPRD